MYETTYTCTQSRLQQWHDGRRFAARGRTAFCGKNCRRRLQQRRQRPRGQLEGGIIGWAGRRRWWRNCLVRVPSSVFIHGCGAPRPQATTRVCDKHYSLTYTPEKNYMYTTTVHMNVSSRGLTSSSDNCSVKTACIYTVETKCEPFRFLNGETLQVLESTATRSAYFQRACHQL